MSDLRIDFLEKKLEVMQSEVSEVLGEMQTTIQALARMLKIATETTNVRLTSLENPAVKQEEVRTEGVEL